MKPDNVPQRPGAVRLEKSLTELHSGQPLDERLQSIKQELAHMMQQMNTLNSRFKFLLWVGVIVVFFGSIAFIYLYSCLLKGG